MELVNSSLVSIKNNKCLINIPGVKSVDIAHAHNWISFFDDNDDIIVDFYVNDDTTFKIILENIKQHYTIGEEVFPHN